MEYDDPPDIASILKLPRRHEAAPRFDGQPSSLVRYLDEICFLGKASNYSDREIIEAAIFYTPDVDYELWNQMPEASNDNWEAFRTAIIDLYPGADGDRKYSFKDLEDLVENNSQSPINDINQFGVFYRDFVRVSSFLKSKSRLTGYEEARMFLLGLHIDLRKAVRARLRLKNPDHHPDDPWTFKEVSDAAIFVISPSAANNDNPVDTTPDSSLQSQINTSYECEECCKTYQQTNVDPVPAEEATVASLSCKQADIRVDVSKDVASIQSPEICGPEPFQFKYKAPYEAAVPLLSAMLASSNTGCTHQVNPLNTTSYSSNKLKGLKSDDPPPPYQEQSNSFPTPNTSVPLAKMGSLDVKEIQQVAQSPAVQGISQASTTFTGAFCVVKAPIYALLGGSVDIQSIQDEQIEVDVKDQAQENFALAFRSHKRHCDLKLELCFTTRRDLDFLRQLVPINYPVKHSESDGGNSKLCLTNHGTRSCQRDPEHIAICFQFFSIGSPLSKASYAYPPSMTSIFKDRVNVQSKGSRTYYESQNSGHLSPYYEIWCLSEFSGQQQANTHSHECIDQASRTTPSPSEVLVAITRYLNFLSGAVQVVLVLTPYVLRSAISYALATRHAKGSRPKISSCQSYRQFGTANGEAEVYQAIHSCPPSDCVFFGVDKDNPIAQGEDLPEG